MPPWRFKISGEQTAMSNKRLTKISNARRIEAYIVAIITIAFMLFSVFFIAVELHHDCSGEDCPICSVIHQCENTFKQVFSSGCVQTAIIMPILFAAVTLLITGSITNETLVSMKVRLND